MAEQGSDPAFEELLEYLRDFRGFDFTGYKRSTLLRRVTKRMQSLGIEGFADYLDHLQVHQDEFTELFNQILINVTAFFRDEPTWEALASEVVPHFMRSKAPHEGIRVWSAGCASGEEPYSIAMILAERLSDAQFLSRVKIYGTDVDEEAIATARQGTYGSKALEPVGHERRDRFFERSESRFVFRRDLRRALIFGRHDLVQDAPISKTDLILCRNALMYLNADTQSRVLDSFRFSLNPDGYLVLGKSEMLFTKMRSFVPLDLKHRIFVRRSDEQENRLNRWPDDEARATQQMASRLPSVAFEDGPVAELLVSSDGHLVLANRSARDLFGLHPDDLGRPLGELERVFRAFDLRSAIDDARTSQGPVELPPTAWRAPDGTQLTLQVRARALPVGDDASALSVAFTDVTEQQQLQQDLETANQELETAMEELQSTNEELETTNEELQSTNEELETMNEELQSTNEELETVNQELSERTMELANTNAFMGSILASVRGSVVVLDHQLRVTVWNRQSEDLWGLRTDEVQGQAFLNLDIGLPLDPIRQQIHRCVSGAEDHQTIVVDATTRRGRSIRCRVQCSRLAGDGQGVVLLMDPETG